MDALTSCDLLVVTGGGTLTDAFAPTAISVLEEVAAVKSRGGIAVMVGQGIGPLSDPALSARAGEVLPHVDLLGLRERVTGPAVLDRLGVPAARRLVTGDDAVELAQSARSHPLSDALGVNLRRARYSGIDASAEECVRSAVGAFTRAVRADVVAIPVSFVPKESDVASIAELVDSRVDVTADWLPPQEIAGRAGRCRAVLTGSYHAAVFALSNGRPVVGVSGSPYYNQKFRGLVDLFGPACRFVEVGPGLESRLVAALRLAWDSNEETSQQALRAADRQVAWSREAYAGIRTLVGSAA